MNDQTLTCDFCWHHCKLSEGQSGVCRVRKHVKGKLVTTTYGQIEAVGVDPIEKKPLYHYYPGSRTFSFALFGCNLACQFCQNHTLSQGEPTLSLASERVEPTKIVSMARERGCHSISYTYSEPLVWQDYMLDVATLAKRAGMQNIMVTNGSFSKEALGRLLPVIDAFNLDIKGDETFYKEVCKGRQKPVLDAIAAIAGTKAHLEVTTMLIESMHSRADVAALGRALHERGVQVWHLSRFFPQYKMAHHKPTSEAYLSEMVKLAQQSGIPYIYSGNSHAQRSTFCPTCHAQLIDEHNRIDPLLEHGRCAHCATAIYGVFE
ncbi:MAG: AmmeMemoRadiSam system radical SAM enzyme [Sphaerochaeta sp.]|nr:AmmeMemoRadiSam system radical SAM enzyme [Sphaerochaeta sp.]